MIWTLYKKAILNKIGNDSKIKKCLNVYKFTTPLLTSIFGWILSYMIFHLSMSTS